MKNYKKYKMFQFLAPFLFIAGIALILAGLNDTKIIKLKYEEDNNIKYNVFLKKNEFFEAPFLGENRTYIASLIDYIDVNFEYKIKYNKQIKGGTKYKYVALVRANKKDAEGYYWEKEYDLSDEKELRVEKENIITISDNVKVKYSTYNEILNRFKKEYGVNTDGELKVIMKINNNANFENVDRPINIDSQLSLSIPLLEQSLEVTINKDDSNEKDILKIKNKSNSKIYLIYKISGAIFVLSSLIGFIVSTKKNIEYKKSHQYKVTLEKILKNYDSIIANTNNLPPMSGLKRIDISTFEELLDVYNEVRMPINYFQNKAENESTFFIINDDIVWIYKLKKNIRNEASWY